MSRKGWPETPLGEVISHRKEFIRITDAEQYKRCRVRLDARGVVLRDRILGIDIKTKEQQVCRTGELLVAEIDAKHGGFGIVPEELDGAIVSSHYFLYEIDNSKLNQRFLDYYLRTPGFQDQIAARGSTNYAAIRPLHVLEYTMPLPDRSKQDRLVSRVDELLGKLDEARSTRTDIEKEAEALLGSAFMRIAQGAGHQKLADVAPLERRPVEITVDGEYPELGVRSFGRGVFHKPTLLGAELTWQKLFRVKAGDIVISNIKAWEGAIAVAGPDDDGRVGSHRYLTLSPIGGKATAGFLCFYLLTDEGLAAIGRASPGSADRNRTLGQKRLMDIEVPVPRFEKQVWFDRLQAKVREMLDAQADAETEFNAMMPSILDRAFRGEL
jgi:type I restriction enzyme S subunit